MKKAIALVLTVLFLFTFACAENVIQWDYDLIIQEHTLSGKYTGEIKDGKPEGYGIFETYTPDGTACHYIGDWMDGLMQGGGAMYWDDGSLEIGQYDKGLFVTGKYNYNGLELLTARKDGDATLNQHWINRITRNATAEEDEQTEIYIGNRNSRVFHRLDCESVRTMKEKNKIEFTTRDEAIKKRYTPCTRCLP